MKTRRQISEKLMEVDSEIVNLTKSIEVCENKDNLLTYELARDRLYTQRKVLDWILW